MQGKPDGDTGSASLADAYKRRVTKRSGKGYSVRLDFADKAGVRVLAEYMDAGVVANRDASGDKSEARACAKALQRCNTLLLVATGHEYSIASMLEATGEFEIIETFTAADDAAANAYAEANHDGEWYVLNPAGRNINAGIDG